MNTIPIMYLSKQGWADNSPSSDNLSAHPCEHGPYANNDVCCLNPLIEQYQTGPCMLAIHNNSGICPYNAETGTWEKNFTEMSSNNAQLRSHLMEGIGVLDFLSDGMEQVPYDENFTLWESIWENVNVNCTDNGPGKCSERCAANCTDNNSTNCTDICMGDCTRGCSEYCNADCAGSNSTNCSETCTDNCVVNGTVNGTVNCFENVTSNISTIQKLTKYLDRLTYPEGVSYEVMNVENGMFEVELRLNHLYLKPRSRETDVDGSSSGKKKYEFYLGVTFVTLQPYTSGVSISTGQVSFEYFKSEFIFMSIATEQEATPVQQLDILIHQAKSVNDNKQYQYMELDFLYDTDRYPGTATVKPDSLRWVRQPSIHGLDDEDWRYPCKTSTGYYYTGDQSALDTMSDQPCLAQKPYFCRFDADKNFFVPFPTEYATSSSGFISGSDLVNNLYLQFILELTDSNGYKHLSTVFFSVDLAAWPVLEQCQDAEFDYKDVTDAIKITATVGVKSVNASSVVLEQTTSVNRYINEIAPASAA
ncbi:hypothetical protein T484DRAFT_1757275 [Baffinella frigidus]|nr:hypothetical protein T484DRAFT_1757275 [Cryptophyta sp. CCMP2293]